MPRNKSGAKQRARDRQRRDGVSYHEARRREADEARQHRPSFAEVIGRARGVDEVLVDAVEDWASRQLGEPAEESIWADLDLPAAFAVAVADPTISQVTVSGHSLWSDTAESYDDGTLATTAFVHASVQVDGLLANAEAEALSESGLVTVLDRDWNNHYTQVVVNQPIDVELEFNAIVATEFESVNDIDAMSARLLARGDA